MFFKAKNDPKALAAWYEKNLGMKLESFGAGTSSFMINYRVDDMVGLLEQLRQNDVPVVKGPEYHENGAFAWIMDPDGNKVEFWEPKIWDDKNKR